MKFYSDITKKFYDTVEDCKEAENKAVEAQKKAEAEKKTKEDARATRAKEVEAAYKAAVEAEQKYVELRNAFINDYHSYHMTYSTTKDLVNDIFETTFYFL